VETVKGIGVFLRARDPEVLRAWYAEHLELWQPAPERYPEG
jgi:hypothetical protein